MGTLTIRLDINGTSTVVVFPGAANFQIDGDFVSFDHEGSQKAIAILALTSYEFKPDPIVEPVAAPTA